MNTTNTNDRSIRVIETTDRGDGVLKQYRRSFKHLDAAVAHARSVVGSDNIVMVFPATGRYESLTVRKDVVEIVWR